MEPVSINPYVQGGDPCIFGQRLVVAGLLAVLLRTAEEHRKEHPGQPYDLSCSDLWDRTLHEYCSDYIRVSQLDAGEALGFVLLALAQLAVNCPETVLKRAVARKLRKEDSNG